MVYARFVLSCCLPALLFAAAAPAAAQGTWRFRSAATVPTAGASGMAFDSVRNVAVMVVPGATNLETWEWNGIDWSLRSTVGPSKSLQANVVFDEARGVTLLFGGTINQTWQWDGTQWMQRSPTQSPIATAPQMAYDKLRSLVVLFGSSNTWEWDGNTWSQRQPLTVPSGFSQSSMAYDAVRGRTVLIGWNPSSLVTWEWDGVNWFQKFPQDSPSSDPVMSWRTVYDSVFHRCILFGGSGPTRAETWAWDGLAYTRLLPSETPAARSGHSMAFDSNRGISILFGGITFRDTWEYDPGVSGSFSAFGSGCAGTRGVPSLSLRSSAPVAGEQFAVQVNNMPLTGAAFMFMGVSKTNYGGLPLPFDLTIIGMQSCSLYASGERLDYLTNVLGTALWTVRVPRSLANQNFYVQAIIADSLANLLGLTVSNAGEALVGW